MSCETRICPIPTGVFAVSCLCGLKEALGSEIPLSSYTLDAAVRERDPAGSHVPDNAGQADSSSIPDRDQPDPLFHLFCSCGECLNRVDG